ncbi:IS3 family transposase [Bacillus sp. JCM 19041]|uniref:IS3 family transposase n=1 Tax=Bacillus sp. JCM 19041 TaxID=1460637 RepID=UPI0006CFFBC9
MAFGKDMDDLSLQQLLFPEKGKTMFERCLTLHLFIKRWQRTEESFWGTYKCESYALDSYNSVAELNTAIDSYMAFYHYQRLQKRLNGLSMEYRLST